jgi:hypothetical protein
MITMILAGLICATVLAFTLHPLMKSSPKTGWRILLAAAVISLGLYLVLGSPDMASAPAAFETSGPRFEQRMAGRRELIVMEALAGDPDNVKLLLELGTIRIEADHPEEALEVLTHARKLAPRDTRIAEAMGAAYFKLALFYKMQPRPEAQKLGTINLDKALAITPKASPLYNELKKLKASP